jgi:hypothetical protein
MKDKKIKTEIKIKKIIFVVKSTKTKNTKNNTSIFEFKLTTICLVSRIYRWVLIYINAYYFNDN